MSSTRALAIASFLVLMAGCSAVDPAKVVPAPARADEAIASIVQFFSMRRPSVYWYAPDDCGAGAIHDTAGGCVFGFRVDDEVILSTQNGVPLHETALAHEFGHLASLEHDGTSDHDHVGRYYLDADQAPVPGKIPDDAHGLVGAGNRLLASEGM